MTSYNLGQPVAVEVLIDDVNQVVLVDGEAFPWDFNGDMLQIGHLTGHDPFVRFQINATVVRRLTADGEQVYAEPGAELDPDFEPDEE